MRKQALDLGSHLWRNHRDQKAHPMNRFEGPGGKEARIRYLDGDFQVMTPGSFVRCAVTGESIPLDELKYWSVARQEPYANAEISLNRELQENPGLRARAKT